MNGEDAVRELWRLFDEGRYDAVRPLLADDFEADWPQTRERIAGPDAFIALNAAYPGRWRCALRHLHGLGDTVISEVEIGDGAITRENVNFMAQIDQPRNLADDEGLGEARKFTDNESYPHWIISVGAGAAVA